MTKLTSSSASSSSSSQQPASTTTSTTTTTSSASPPSAITDALPSKISAHLSTSNRDKIKRFQIFLGGSCNPTTWRQNVAIPFLEINGITYYNPQVDNWTPEVVSFERDAKQNAQILLFVIDKQTRSTVSIVESAFMAGDNRNLVLVIYPFEYRVVNFVDDQTKLTSNSIQETLKSNLYKETHNSILMSEGSDKEKTSQEISSSHESHDLASSATSSPTLSGEEVLPSRTVSSKTRSVTTVSKSSTTITRSSNSLLRIGKAKNLPEKEIVVDEKSSQTLREERQVRDTIKICGELISLNEFNELRQARYLLQCLLSARQVPIFHDINQALRRISKLLQLYENDSSSQIALNFDQYSNTTADDLKSIRKNNQQHNFLFSDRDQNNSSTSQDIYLSSDDDDRPTIESIVIPVLKSKGLSYHYSSVNTIIGSMSSKTDFASAHSQNSTSSPMFDRGCQRDLHQREISDDEAQCRLSDSDGYAKSTISDEYSLSIIENEKCTVQKSRAVLFVITKRCRGLTIMVLASHFMALFRENVVLCVQYLEEPCVIGGETLTKNAIADYNRGRVYLCDYANKWEVPVFASVGDAIECCNKKCQDRISHN